MIAQRLAPAKLASSYVLALQTVRPSDRQVGAKARTLARLARLGLPVPPGVVLHHAAWLVYLASCDAQQLWNAFVAQPDEEHATPLRRLLAEAPLPADLPAVLYEALQQHVDGVPLTTLPATADSRPTYAVRSAFGGEDSASEAVTGIFESQLAVGVADLDAAVRAVWASALGERALAYYRHAGTVAALSVLIQVLPPLDCAGVVFSVAPDDTDAMQVQAVWGLAEPLVQGKVRPDRWLLERTRGRVLHHEPGERNRALWPAGHGVAERPLASRAPAPLHGRQLATLRRLALRIERVLGGPQDIEWAHDGHQFWVVQARPVTVAALAPPDSALWTAAIFRGIYPDLPSPLALSTILAGQQEAFIYYSSLESRLAAQPFIAAFKGRPFFNVSLLVEMVAGWGLPATVITAAMGGELPATIDRPAYRRLRPGRLLAALPPLLRLQLRHMQLESQVQHALAWMDDQELRLSRLPAPVPIEEAPGIVVLHTAAWTRLVAESLNLISALSKPLFLLHLLLPASHNALQAERPTISTRLALDLQACARAAQESLVPGTSSISVETLRALPPESAFKQRFDQVLNDYGYRSFYENDLAWPRFAEQPELLLEVIVALVHSPHQPAPVRRQGLRARLVRPLLQRAQRLLELREELRSASIRVFAQLRRHDLALGAGWAEMGALEQASDVFWLTLDELGDAIADPAARNRLAELVARRKGEYATYAGYRFPRAFTAAEIERFAEQPLRTAPRLARLSGQTLVAGRVRGRVLRAASPADARAQLANQGAEPRILVVPSVDPGWVLYLLQVQGVVAESGGDLSHGSIILRELGIPSLINCAGAWEAFVSNDIALLDAGAGWIERSPP